MCCVPMMEWSSLLCFLIIAMPTHCPLAPFSSSLSHRSCANSMQFILLFVLGCRSLICVFVCILGPDGAAVGFFTMAINNNTANADDYDDSRRVA